MRALLLLSAAAVLLHSAVFEVQYAVSFWFLGRIGTTTMHFESADGRYRIEANATLEGIAALIAHHHSEHHVSSGHIAADGTLIPKHYDVTKTLDDYRSIRHYYFDRRHRRILLQQQTERTVSERRFDIDSMQFDTKRRLKKSAFVRLEPFYAENDLLSLYFNVRNVLGTLKASEQLQLSAVGARNGEVHISRQNGMYDFFVYLDQDIFRSKEGKLFVQTDRDLYVKSAVMKDVLLFGDLDVEREWLRQSP